jgi:hypothetical protein
VCEEAPGSRRGLCDWNFGRAQAKSVLEGQCIANRLSINPKSLPKWVYLRSRVRPHLSLRATLSSPARLVKRSNTSMPLDFLGLATRLESESNS